MMILSSRIYQAAELKAYYSVTFADCFTLATALKHTAAIVICDPELRKVEHPIDVVWIERAKGE
jgi:predicted nucleic acid-binding protein